MLFYLSIGVSSQRLYPLENAQLLYSISANKHPSYQPLSQTHHCMHFICSLSRIICSSLFSHVLPHVALPSLDLRCHTPWFENFTSYAFISLFFIPHPSPQPAPHHLHRPAAERPREWLRYRHLHFHPRPRLLHSHVV